MHFKRSFLVIICLAALITVMVRCSENKEEKPVPVVQLPTYGGFDSKVKWGEHLVTIIGCNDCHTPKKMTAMGPVVDSSLWLSGHPGNMPIADVDRKQAEAKGWAVSNDLTSWVGPWGVSYTANLTSDSTTGIGAWTKENFITALRQGKKSGAPAGRALLPPMPWEWFSHMTDDELDAIFAYLLTTKPIKNAVPSPLPPLSAMH